MAKLHEELKAAGMTEEILKQKELLKQFLPNTVVPTNLHDENEDVDPTAYQHCDMPKNPVATQLLWITAYLHYSFNVALSSSLKCG